MLQVQLQRRAGKNMCNRTEWWWFEEWWFDYTTSLCSKENTQYFDWGNITRTMQFYNCQLKTNNYDKKYLWLQNIQSRGFCWVFARVYLGSCLFLFLDTRQGPFVPTSFTHFTHFSRMADKEHNYSIPDSTTVSLRLLCSLDFPDAVPFHVTDLEMSPTPPGKSKLRIFFVTAATIFAGLGHSQPLI